MMTDKLVSVVVPTYKGSEVIARAVDSVLQQSYPEIEIIVVDDNSPDSPERMATELAMKRYNDIKNVVYLKHEVNKNGAAARNTGINYSHGEYVAFLDDDDWFLPEKIKIQIGYLQQHPEYEACYCLAQREGKPIETIPYQGNVSKELLLMKSRMFTPTLFFRKQSLLAIKGFDESYRRHQDYEMLLRFFQKGFRIGCVEVILTELGTGGGFNYPTPEKMLEIKNNFLKQFNSAIDLIELSEPGFKKKLYARHYGIVFMMYIIEGQFLHAMPLAFKYFINSPVVFISPLFHKVRGYLARRFRSMFIYNKNEC